MSINLIQSDTLKNDNTGKPDFSDYLIFALIPIILASLLVYNNVQIQGEITSIIVTTLAIFVGLMLNVIVIIFDISKINLPKLRFFGWGQQAEILTYLVKNSTKIYEAPISYYGRTYEEGKKINWKDGFRALYCILKYGFFKSA